MKRLATSLAVLAAITLYSGYCLALPRVMIDSANAKQGKCFTIRLVPPEGITAASAEFLGKKIKLFKQGDDYRAIIGIPVAQKTGPYPLSLNMTGINGKTTKLVRSVKVLPYKFPRVSFWLKPSKRKLMATPAVVEEWALIDKPLLVEREEQAWKRNFILPVKGQVSMYFGTIEKVNGKSQGRHRGCDIAVPIGTKVSAANDGTVVFAQKMTVYGGTMVIDHGQGIHTIYLHLSKFLAKVGQEVTKGEVIALSGNTGYSSGPHLHWAMSVHDLRVDPLQWTKTSF
jgi:murein DD-endopeptidase MepM/ murein hydrolase activator NlpD